MSNTLAVLTATIFLIHLGTPAAWAQSTSDVMVTPNELVWTEMPTFTSRSGDCHGGTLHMGYGDTLDRSKTRMLSAGSVAVMQPNTKHFSWTEEETIVQIHGVGPLIIHYENPADDPRKK